MKSPAVSIIVPVLKAEAYIKNVISDIARQTCRAWELIVVGNGPDQDAQRAIVEAVAANDDRISYLSIQEAGVSRARNAGIEHARGRWIAFVDADDRLPADWLRNYLAHVDGAPDMIVGGIISKVDGKTKRADLRLERDGIVHDKPEKFLPLFMSDIAAMYSPCTKLYRAEFLNASGVKFRESISIYEDGIFNLELALKCNSMCFVRQTGYEYVLHPETSAIGRSHSCISDAVNFRRMLKGQMLRRAGLPSEEITRRVESQYAADVLDIFLNDFRMGCEKTFGDKVAQTRQMFSDARLAQAWRSVRSIVSNPPLTVFRVFQALHAPGLCVMAFTILFALRRCWRKCHAPA